MADLTGDGKEDLLSGSWPGTIYLFEGVGRGRFGERREVLEPPPLPKDHRYAKYKYTLLQSSAPNAADWDGDGKVDLVIGTIAGDVYLFRNEAARGAARFATPVHLVDGSRKFAKGLSTHKAGPGVADWDLDGDLDLLVGTESSGVLLFRNVGSRGEPRLADPVSLEPGGKPFKSGYRFKPTVADWNLDGLPDLLIGNCESEKVAEEKHVTHGYVFLCLREKAPAREP